MYRPLAFTTFIFLHELDDKIVAIKEVKVSLGGFPVINVDQRSGCGKLGRSGSV
jgi:hypothetical protein